MIRPTCEITDQLARKTAFRLSFNLYTPYTDIKTTAQNAPKCTIIGQKMKKKFWGGAPPLQPFPSFFFASILVPLTLGVPVPFHLPLER